MPNVTSAKPSRVSDVCDPKYEKPSPEEHECFFPCVYGTCRVVGGSYGCACDTHASGSICSGRCCKNCGEYGKCVPAVNDQEVCECHPLFTGEFCDVYVPRNVCDSDQTLITPQEPLPIQTCNDELTCVYGRCNISSSGASICSCDPGAYGANCSRICCLECGEHGTCVLNSTGQEICRCKSSYTGVLCETKVARITDVCHPNYTRPPSDEQECFACLNGLCRKRDIDTFECECDENAYDLQCSRKCCKSCGTYGICVISLDDTQVCECHPLFTGEFCDVYVSRNVCDTEQTYVNKPLVPLPSQICSDELVCVHGICNTSEDGPVFCICDPGADGVDCNQTCCLDCGQYGVCVLDTAGNETCECEDKYSGEYCDVLVITQPGQLVDTGKDDDDNDWVYWVVGACILVILLLILVTFIVLYIMWKRRVILVMKVVHYFQEYEDGDNRQWDALITVQKNSLAEEFAISTLCPKLEKEMGFNVSIRDPTEAKSEKDEIVRAAEKSRRTIIVVSPKNMFIPEFKAEKLKQIHDRSKVITILLEDTHVFKDTVNEDLKTVFGNAMQIQWPRSENPKAVENFWKRLELCMPKKKRKHKYSPITNSPVTLLSMKTHLNGETDKMNLNPDSVMLSV